MKTKQFAATQFMVLTLFSGIVNAQMVAYDTTVGGLYNAVGPVENSPEFIGDKFTVSISGWLDSIDLPLDNFFTFAGPIADGTLTLWSDNNGAVGSPLFSASVSATYSPPSNTQLPGFSTILVGNAAPVFLNKSTYYWLTLSQTSGSDGLVFFSNVNLASAETVYFGGNTNPQYAEGLQPMVVQVSVNPVPEPATCTLWLVGFGLAGIIAALKHKKLVSTR